MPSAICVTCKRSDVPLVGLKEGKVMMCRDHVVQWFKKHTGTLLNEKGSVWCVGVPIVIMYRPTPGFFYTLVHLLSFVHNPYTITVALPPSPASALEAIRLVAPTVEVRDIPALPTPLRAASVLASEVGAHTVIDPAMCTDAAARVVIAFTHGQPGAATAQARVQRATPVESRIVVDPNPLTVWVPPPPHPSHHRRACVMRMRGGRCGPERQVPLPTQEGERGEGQVEREREGEGEGEGEGDVEMANDPTTSSAPSSTSSLTVRYACVHVIRPCIFACQDEGEPALSHLLDTTTDLGERERETVMTEAQRIGKSVCTPFRVAMKQLISGQGEACRASLSGASRLAITEGGCVCGGSLPAEGEVCTYCGVLAAEYAL
ncbi:hypothetical protein KIPB_007399 [Kipferlia bialata]|uniref:Uncharacterized protein n=1 Tax=Kipferlia bialata TaxID=797122 RepID=A0A9K3CYH7_9EUKA|nr:hypothetical protein KIPB_007399 [Kipferlia bialata]|eukprot:g7399.t1